MTEKDHFNSTTTKRRPLAETVGLGQVLRTRSETAMYHAIGLLQANSDFSIAQAETRLKQALPDHSVISDGNRIRVERGDWWIAMELVAGPASAMRRKGL